MASMNTELINDIDSVVDAAIRAGASGMSGYIIPAAWVIIAISMLVWAILVANGKVESPMQDWLIKIGFFLFVISASGGMYGDWLVKSLRALQTDLPAVMNPNSFDDPPVCGLQADEVDTVRQMTGQIQTSLIPAPGFDWTAK